MSVYSGITDGVHGAQLAKQSYRAGEDIEEGEERREEGKRRNRRGKRRKRRGKRRRNLKGGES